MGVLGYGLGYYGNRAPSIHLRMATETVTAILLPGTRLIMVTRQITVICSLMGMPLLLRLLPLRLFTPSSRRPCRSSRKLKLPTIGTTAGTRKGITPTLKNARMDGCKSHPSRVNRP